MIVGASACAGTNAPAPILPLPNLCHAGLTLFEAIVPFVELPPL
jgi:hypothetical protein